MALCYSTSRAAVELARKMKKHMGRPRAQTVLAEFPGPPVLLGSSQGVPKSSSVVMRAAIRLLRFQVFTCTKPFNLVTVPQLKSATLFALGTPCELPSNTGEFGAVVEDLSELATHMCFLTLSASSTAARLVE